MRNAERGILAATVRKLLSISGADQTNTAFRIPHSTFRIPHSAFRVPHSYALLPSPNSFRYTFTQFQIAKVVENDAGEPWFCDRRKTGANLETEEDFFASSPSANLVGSTKKDMTRVAERL